MVQNQVLEHTLDGSQKQCVPEMQVTLLMLYKNSNQLVLYQQYIHHIIQAKKLTYIKPKSFI